MTTQSKERQRARRRATDAATLARVREAKKDQRVSRLATKLAVTMARRDEAIERWDRRLGEVLVALTRGSISGSKKPSHGRAHVSPGVRRRAFAPSPNARSARAPEGARTK